MQVLPLDAQTPQPLVESWHRLRTAVEVELEPNVPPAPLDEALPSSLSDDLCERVGRLALDADAVVGYSVLELRSLDNPQLAMLDVTVDPTHRRQGIATVLTRLAAKAAQSAGRRTILVEARDGTAGAATCAALGGHPALRSTSSALRVADVDRDLVNRWIGRRTERAAGYSLTRWIGPCPDELLMSFAELREAMETAPKGDLDITIEWSGKSIRAAEAAHARCRRRNLVLCARFDATGELVALTDVLVPQGRPTLAFQEDTVVRPDHRNRGLGRWVKAEMLRWLAEEEPQLEQIVTWNATENAAMRGINTELGFVPGDTWAEWQFSVDDLLSHAG
jgi:GNAT superfamily N-acetyltransferase